MSRAEQRRMERDRQQKGLRTGRHPAWILVSSVVVALAVVGAFAQMNGTGGHHPIPRSPELASDVVPAARYEAYPRVETTYEIAAAIPGVLDGMYCYCHCSEHSAHYSLLDCFASDHASACDICMSEAEIAYEMSLRGADLDAIRVRVDQTYGL